MKRRLFFGGAFGAVVGLLMLIPPRNISCGETLALVALAFFFGQWVGGWYNRIEKW